MKSFAFVLVLLAAVTVGCTPEDSESPFPVTPVLITHVNELPGVEGDLVTAYGFYFDSPAPTLCGIVKDSDPPLCGGFSVELSPEFDAATSSLITVRGVLTGADSIEVHSFTYGDSSKVDDPEWMVLPEATSNTVVP